MKTEEGRHRGGGYERASERERERERAMASSLAYIGTTSAALRSAGIDLTRPSLLGIQESVERLAHDNARARRHYAAAMAAREAAGASRAATEAQLTRLRTASDALLRRRAAVEAALGRFAAAAGAAGARETFSAQQEAVDVLSSALDAARARRAALERRRNAGLAHDQSSTETFSGKTIDPDVMGVLEGQMRSLAREVQVMRADEQERQRREAAMERTVKDLEAQLVAAKEREKVREKAMATAAAADRARVEERDESTSRREVEMEQTVTVVNALAVPEAKRKSSIELKSDDGTEFASLAMQPEDATLQALASVLGDRNVTQAAAPASSSSFAPAIILRDEPHPAAPPSTAPNTTPALAAASGTAQTASDAPTVTVDPTPSAVVAVPATTSAPPPIIIPAPPPMESAPPVAASAPAPAPVIIPAPAEPATSPSEAAAELVTKSAPKSADQRIADEPPPFPPPTRRLTHDCPAPTVQVDSSSIDAVVEPAPVEEEASSVDEGVRVLVLYDFVAEAIEELSVSADEYVTYYENEEDKGSGWCMVAKDDGSSGTGCLRRLYPPILRTLLTPLLMTRRRRQRDIVVGHELYHSI